MIAATKLTSEKLKIHFKNHAVFELKDIITFYEENEKGINYTTINWRVYKLIQSGFLQRIGRGRFTLGEAKTYTPEIALSTKNLFEKLKKAFPYANLCIWNTAALNEFMLHQPAHFSILIETDKESIHSIFYFLREIKKTVFINPTKDILEKYSLNTKEVFIVKALITETPIQKIDGVLSPTLEKILVDVFCDAVIFEAQQGAEMRTIFKEAFTKYTLNQSKMLRYADRRRRKEAFSHFIKTILVKE